MALKNKIEIFFIMVKKWSQLIEHYDTKNISIIAGTLPLGPIFKASTLTSWNPD